jgi:hypothetical protein
MMERRAMGRQGSASLATAVALLLATAAGGCGSKKTTSNETPQAVEGCEETPCDLGVCDVESGKCVECLTDGDCRGEQTCVAAACTDDDPETPVQLCTPGTARCSVDRAAVLSCSADGSRESFDACAADAPCTQRALGTALCADWKCSPNSFSCAGNTLLLCSDDGTTSAPFHTCEADQYCDARRALCVARVCAPGEKTCDGAVLYACNDEGSEQVEEVTCSLSEECSPAGCEPLSCVPNATFCRESKVWQCNGRGTSSRVIDDCVGADQFCQERDGEAACSDQACFPSDPICDGGVATTCKPDGSGPKPGGEDCSETDQLCFGGRCLDRVCTPGQKACVENDVHLCADNGTDTTLYRDCYPNEYCEAANGSCRVQVCAPGAPGCFGTIRATCKDDGSGYDPGSTDCADSGKVCENGSCLPQICAPSSRICVDGGVAYCNYAGTALSQASPCYQGSHCLKGDCVANVCVPGQPACDGTIVSTCNQQGSGASPGDPSNDCAAQGQVCDDGACKASVCKPNGQFCRSGNIQRCSATGASSTLEQYCYSETYCKELSDTTAECAPKLCVTGAIGCLGEDYGTCANDGATLEPGFGDCDGAGQVCSMTGCAAAAVDELGGTAEVQPLSPGTVVFNRVRTTTPRKLTRIAAYLSLPSTRTLRWTVYALVGFYEWQLMFDQVTTASGAQFHSSDAMSLTLESGKEYLVGVSVTGGSFVAYLGPLSGQQRMSFGTASGSGTAGFGPTISYFQANSTALLASRLTTALP